MFIRRAFCLLMILGAALMLLGGAPVLAQPEAAVWYVDAAVPASGDGTTAESAFKTIPEALSHAAAGDTVSVAAGTYLASQMQGTDTEILVPSGVRLLGAGSDVTTINGQAQVRSVVILSYQSVLEGFAVVGSCGYWNDCQGVKTQAGGAVVRSNHIADNQVGVRMACEWAGGTCDEEILVESNLIVDNMGLGITLENGAKPVIRSNTLVRNYAGIGGVSSSAVVENNIVAFNLNYGIGCTFSEISHNGLWHNGGADLTLCTQGEGVIVQDPWFRSATNNDFRLGAGSPMRGRSTPSGIDYGAIPFEAVGAPPTGLKGEYAAGHVLKVSWSDVGAEAYNVYWGSEPDLYTERFENVQVAAVTKTVESLFSSVYFAVGAVYSGGAESELSPALQVQAPALTGGSAEHDSVYVWPDSEWMTVSTGQASAGSYLSSATKWATLQVHVSGDSLVLRRRLGPDGGVALFVVDNEQRGTLDFYHPVEKWQVPATIDDLGPGNHVVEIIVAGFKHASSSGFSVNFDTASVPAIFKPSPVQTIAEERINYYRAIAGLPAARGVPALHMAAQAHAEFYAQNRNDPRMAGLGFHSEHADLPGFTGESPSDRAKYFGYSGSAGEDGHFLGDPIASVADWMATVYHRNLIMCYGCIDVGYGMVNGPSSRVDALSMGSWSYPRPDVRKIYTYPAVNQRDVLRLWNGNEIPDPLPGHARPVGYPISLYLAQPQLSVDASAQENGWAPDSMSIPDATTPKPSSPYWSVTAAELTTAAGDVVPVIMLDQNTDVPKYLGPDVVFLIPEAPLAENTTYVAHIAGTDSRGNAFDHRWAFSTGSTLLAPDFSASRYWADPLVSAAGGAITYRARIANSEVAARTVSVDLSLPAGVTYVQNSATTSQGTVSGEGPFVFSIGDMAPNSVVTIGFDGTVSSEIVSPTGLESSMKLSWSMGALEQSTLSIADGTPLHLPMIRRAR